MAKYPTTENLPNETDWSAEFAELQRKHERLCGVVEGLARASALECIVENGLHEVATKLDHLRLLAPQVEALNDKQAKQLKQIRRSLSQPDFTANIDPPTERQSNQSPLSFEEKAS